MMVGKTREAGSPPRMRGKPFPADGSSTVRRITPADAGKTGIAVVGGVTEEDHPRGCGENCFAIFVVFG